MPGRKPEPYESRYIVNTTTGCWEWQRAITNGYGYMNIAGKTTMAHRFYYEMHRETIPDGLEIDHLCENRRCVNPDHLEVVTHQENQRRGGSVSGRNARKTHCPQGHSYLDPDNLYVGTRGHRCCRTCMATASRSAGRLQYQQEWRKKRKALGLPVR